MARHSPSYDIRVWVFGGECLRSAGVGVVVWFGRLNGYPYPDTVGQVAYLLRNSKHFRRSPRSWLLGVVVALDVVLTCGGIAHCPPAVGAGGQWWPVLSGGGGGWCYWVLCSLVGITNTWVVLVAVVIV